MNGSSFNNRTWYYSHNVPAAEKIGFTVAYLVLFFVALVGNSFVIHVARKLLAVGRGPFTIFVINMAASDILYAVIIVAHETKRFFLGHLWFPGRFGTFLCKFCLFGVAYAISSSILTLTTMTVDRYLAIVPNVKRPMTRKTVIKVIFAIVLISLICSWFPLIRMNTVTRSSQTLCGGIYLDIPKDVVDKLITAEYICYFVVFYVIPVVIRSILYFRIVHFLWLRQIPGHRTERNERQRRKQTKKVTCMLITMASTFAVTWFPMHLMHYYGINYQKLPLPFKVELTLFWLSHSNCATNPCFYFIFCKEYREELKRVLSKAAPAVQLFNCRNRANGTVNFDLPVRKGTQDVELRTFSYISY